MFRVASALLALLLALAASRNVEAKRPLNPGIYQSPQACLDAMWAAANARLQSNDQIANCIRMCFHDAGTYVASTDTGGADGSIQFAQELAFPANAGLGICAGVMPAILADVRAVPGCGQATFADVLQVSCAVGTFVLGGSPIAMWIGRPDAAGPDLTANDRLPGPCNDAAGLIGFWQDKGMSNPVAASIVLNGAHGLGAVRANGPTCIPGGGAVSAIRTAGPAFDGSYYNRLLDPNIQGHFNSDIATVVPGAPTLGLAQQFAADHASFQAAWVSQFQEMSLLGCDTAGTPPLFPSSLPPVRVNVGVQSSPPPPPPVVVDSPPPPPPVVFDSPPPPPVVFDSPPPPPVVFSSPPPPPVVFSSPPPPPVVFSSPPPPPAFLPAPSPPPPPPVAVVSSPPPPPAKPGTCQDAFTNPSYACAYWASQNACGYYYQGRLVRELCAKTCGACPTATSPSPPPPPPKSVVYNSPPPPQAKLASPPPPARGPACGKRGRYTYYCPAFPKYKCCSKKTCCPANRVCCGTACCSTGKKCCSYKTFYYPTRKWYTTQLCKNKC